MILNNIVTVIVFSLLVLTASLSYGFDNENTHRALSDTAIAVSKFDDQFLQVVLDLQDGLETKLKSFNRKKPQNIIGWIQDGSQEEDEPNCRASSHFHNPLKELWSSAGLTDNNPVIDDYCSSIWPEYAIKYSNVMWATSYYSPGEHVNYLPNNDLVFSNDYKEIDTNGRNWDVARRLYYEAMTSGTGGDAGYPPFPIDFS